MSEVLVRKRPSYLLPGRYTVRVTNTRVLNAFKGTMCVAEFRLLEVHETEDPENAVVGKLYTALFNVDGVVVGVEGAARFLFACDVPKKTLSREDVIQYFLSTGKHVGRILLVECEEKMTKMGRSFHVLDWKGKAWAQ